MCVHVLGIFYCMLSSCPRVQFCEKLNLYIQVTVLEELLIDHLE